MTCVRVEAVVNSKGAAVIPNKEFSMTLTKVVSLPKDRALVKVKDKSDSCEHSHVEIDQDMRTIHCADCGAIIDPFDWLVRFGMTEEKLTFRIQRLKDDIEYLTTKLKRLSNAKKTR